VNVYRQLVDLLPSDRLDVGQVASVQADGVAVILLSGETLRVRGTAIVGAYVYIQGGVIVGPAPSLSEGADQEV
jgi:hypothetical protein